MQKRDLNKSVECFIAEASLEDEEVNEAFNERSSEADRPTFDTSLLQVGSVPCSSGNFETDKDSNSHEQTNRIVLLPLQSKEPQPRSNSKPIFKDGSFLMLTLTNFQMKE